MSAAEPTVYPSKRAECPYGLYARMRAEQPVYEDTEARSYIVWKHEDIAHVLANPDEFPVLEVDDNPAKHALTYEGMHHLGLQNPPDHGPMRQFLSRPFTPGRIRGYIPMITATADRLIDGFIERGEAEFVGEFGYPLPASVICQLLGLPGEGEIFDFVKRWSTIFVAASDASVADIPAMHIFIREQLVERYAEPRDDVMSEMVRVQVERDGELDLRYLVTLATELVAGGVLTTGQVIAHSLLLLLENPEEMGKVRGNASLIPPMFEEALRLELPIQYRDRVTTKDVELSGVKIPAGARLWLVYASGSRDEARFDEAEKFVVDRPNRDLKGHFGFGYGAHFCLGAPLARLEGRIAFERLFDRIGEIRLAEGHVPRHLDSDRQLFRGLEELHIEFEPAQVPATA
jgi:cytochrome P450